MKLDENQLDILIQNYLALKESKSALDRFESAMVKLITQTLDELRVKVKLGLKAVKKETGCDWSNYLESFSLWDWDTPGQFQEEIYSSLRDQIALHIRDTIKTL